MVCDQQLCLQVQQLQEDKKLTQQHLLKTEETLQQVMRQSDNLQQRLIHEQEAVNRRTRDTEEENLSLHQQVSPVLSHITCSTHTLMSLQYVLLYSAQYAQQQCVVSLMTAMILYCIGEDEGCSSEWFRRCRDGGT